jgi:hypothetical protein
VCNIHLVSLTGGLPHGFGPCNFHERVRVGIGEAQQNSIVTDCEPNKFLYLGLVVARLWFMVDLLDWAVVICIRVIICIGVDRVSASSLCLLSWKVISSSREGRLRELGRATQLEVSRILTASWIKEQFW